jgi:hypothetical protein
MKRGDLGFLPDGTRRVVWLKDAHFTIDLTKDGCTTTLDEDALGDILAAIHSLGGHRHPEVLRLQRALNGHRWDRLEDAPQ